MQKLIHLIHIMVLVLLVSALPVVGAGSKLEIEKVEITRDGDTILSTSSTSGSFDVDPGDELRIIITLKNNYDDDTDNDLEDVRVLAVIEDIDDGDDEDDSDTVDVRADSRKRVTLRLRIPEDASSYESYDLDITACGEDQNGTEHCDEADYDIDVDREEHELVFNTLRMSDAYCDGDATIRMEIQNIGEQEEYDAEIKVYHNSLGTLYSDTFDIASIDDDEEDNIYSTTKRLDVQGLNEGRHTMNALVLYDDGLEKLEKRIEFYVECERRSGDEKAEEDEEPRRVVMVERYENPDRDLSFLFGEEEQEVVVQTPPPGTRPPRQPSPPPKDEGFGTFVLALANIAIIIFILLLVRTLYDR